MTFHCKFKDENRRKSVIHSNAVMRQTGLCIKEMAMFQTMKLQNLNGFDGVIEREREIGR